MLRLASPLLCHGGHRPYYAPAQARCHFQKQDYLNIKGMELEAYDAAFYMESSLHCENRTQTFSEAPIPSTTLHAPICAPHLSPFLV